VISSEKKKSIEKGHKCWIFGKRLGEAIPKKLNGKRTHPVHE